MSGQTAHTQKYYTNAASGNEKVSERTVTIAAPQCRHLPISVECVAVSVDTVKDPLHFTGKGAEEIVVWRANSSFWNAEHAHHVTPEPQ